MALKTMLFLGLFVTCCLGGLFVPLLGACGYVAHYLIGPERQWWSAPVNAFGVRYSFSLAIFTAVGIALNWRSLHYGKQFFRRQEVLVLVFLGIIWLSVLIGAPTVGRYEGAGMDHPSVKMTKIVFFAFMMTHLVTTRKRLDVLLWVLIAGALVLGLQAYDTPRRAFNSGRLDTVGGADFSESNVLSAYLVALLPLIGVQFMKSKWLGKAVCLIAGVFVTNAVVLTRSRGAVVGLAGCMLAAIALAPKKLRAGIIVGVIVAAAGAYYLMDPQFIGRASTIQIEGENRDRSSESRLEIWKGSVGMLAANPLGVGAGNFHQTIGRYAPTHPGRDAHNTFVRCYGELGIQGIAFFLLLMGSVALMLWRIIRNAPSLPQEAQLPVTYIAYGLLLSLVAWLGCSLTVTLLYTEGFWWFVAIPVCLSRVVENLKAEADEKLVTKTDARVPSLPKVKHQRNERR